MENRYKRLEILEKKWVQILENRYRETYVQKNRHMEPKREYKMLFLKLTYSIKRLHLLPTFFTIFREHDNDRSFSFMELLVDPTP